MKPFVLSVCGDPGGARALIPVFDRLDEQKLVKQIHFTYIASTEVLQQHGFAVNSLDSSQSTLPEVGKILRDFSPHLILTGTSMHELAFEKIFIQQAQQMGIPSLSVIDFWSNYSMRFDDNTTGELKYLPTKIAVMDTFCKDRMMQEGFPTDRIIITGQPAFEQIEKKLSDKTPIDSKKVKSGYNIPPDGLLLLFFSQPMRKYFSGTQDDPGYDEFTVVQDLLDLLANIQTALDEPIFLGILPHPTQKVADFEMFAGENCQVIEPLQADGDLMFSADLILGMTSSRLMEALILNCPVLSLQPGCQKPFIFPQTSSGTIPVLTDRRKITKQILTLLKQRKANSQNVSPESKLEHSGAAEKIENLVYQLLKIEHQKVLS